MYLYFTLISFLFGLIIGSFLNVLILRHNTGRKLGGRSGCMSCSKKLRWYELVPFFSWVAQRGKCRGCGSSISIQYPLVELSTGFLFAGMFYFLVNDGVYSMVPLLSIAVTASMVIAIVAYDIKHMIIPDGWSAIFAISSLIFSAFYWFDTPLDLFTTTNGMWHLLAGPIFFIPFWAIWFFSKGKWMGLGDGKLVVGIGWLLGLNYGVAAIVISFWIGAIVGVIILLITRLLEKSKHITMKSEIPFGPFLLIGTIIIFFLQMDLMSIMNLII